MNGISTVCMIQSGQFEQIHDGRKYYIVELTKYPAFPLWSPGGSHPHLPTLVQNKLPPHVFILQVHGVICDKDKDKEFEYEQKKFSSRSSGHYSPQNFLSFFHFPFLFLTHSFTYSFHVSFLVLLLSPHFLNAVLLRPTVGTREMRTLTKQRIEERPVSGYSSCGT